MVVYLWACFFSRASFCVHGISLHETKKNSLHNKYHKLLLPAVLSFFLLPPPPPNLKMSQCVPSWDIDETPLADRIALHPNLNTHELITSQANPMLYDGVAELTWENGHLAMHGLRPPRVAATGKQTTTKYSWDKPRASGTLESIVNQATQLITPPSKSSPFRRGGDDGLISWFDSHRNHHCATVPTTSNTMSMDGLVPRSSNTPANNFTSHDHNHHNHHHMQTLPKTGTGAGTCGNGNSTHGESCSGTDRRRELMVEEEFVRKRARVEGSSRSNNNHSVMESRHVGVPDHTSEMDLEVGFTSTSLGSQDYTNANTHDDSVSHSRTQRELGAEEDKKGNNEKSTVSTKRSRAAAIHNQSERKRRDKINQRMKTLQKLVPNSSKTDKASMLDEVIEYLKQLQAQVQMMSRMSMPQLMMPMAMPQHLQMAMMAQMRMGMGMGMGMGMDMNTVGGPNISGIPPVLNPAAAFMPISSWDGTGSDRVPSSVTVLPDPMANFLATQSQPMNTDAYSRMAALYQQLHQQQVSNSKT